MSDQDLAEAIKATPKRARTLPRIDRMRGIIEAHQAARTEGLLVDATTAKAYVTAWDALNETNRAKVDGLPLRKAVDVVWKLFR